MNNFVTSQIRTYVPIVVGAVLTYLAKEAGIVIDETSSAALITGVQALVTGAYYFIARWIETRYPQFGYMLGSKSQPTYKEVK